MKAPNAIEVSEEMVRLFLDECCKVSMDCVDRKPTGDEKEAAFGMVKFHDEIVTDRSGRHTMHGRIPQGQWIYTVTVKAEYITDLE